MQIEVYSMTADGGNLVISREAVCDSFSSFLWDIEYYKCGKFEVYIAANSQNIGIFRTGRIEFIKIETERFLMCLLERRIIYPTLNFTSERSYAEIVRTACKMRAYVFMYRLQKTTYRRILAYISKKAVYHQAYYFFSKVI